MSDYIISCCSTADLTKEKFAAKDIKYICFHFELDGKQYPDDLGESIAFPDFYKAMADGADTKTSQVGVGEYEEFFEPFLKEGKDIVHLTLSSGISGSYNSARIAAESLGEKYPDRKIYIIDSLIASAGFGLLVDEMADKRASGMSIDELRDWTEERKLYYHAWFFSTDLTFYIKGGRVSKASGVIGGLLNICPLLNMDFMGKLIPRMKIRTKQKVIRQIVDTMMENVKDGADYQGKCFISHSACYEDAKAVADRIEERIPALKGKIEIFYIGTTIGAHTGPGTVALFFESHTKRVD